MYRYQRLGRELGNAAKVKQVKTKDLTFQYCISEQVGNNSEQQNGS